MRRRNFLAALLAAPFAPWKKIFGTSTHFFFNQPPTRIDTLDLSKWGTFTLTGVDECFREGDLIRIYGTVNREIILQAVVKVLERQRRDILVRVVDPIEWDNLARHA